MSSWIWGDILGQEIPNFHDPYIQYYCTVWYIGWGRYSMLYATYSTRSTFKFFHPESHTVKELYYQTSMINNVTFCASVMSSKDADISLLTNKQISIKGLSLCEQFWKFSMKEHLQAICYHITAKKQHRKLLLTGIRI